ncbi:MAG: G/U mismatch-specific DNA glycosylase [Candidatus Firestonebacteria bacterium]|nr:G/U mismatch-specific DNA glycosylase [Candidatus Firestonebacteria bacterium]
MERRKPTKDELQSAVGKTIPDVIAPGLDVLFCGINPGLYSGATGCHFARPGNRFWPALFSSGITERLLSPFEQKELLRHGVGITNLVHRTTATADELTSAELRSGGRNLEAKVKKYRPRFLAVLGIQAYEKAFLKPGVNVGLQAESLGYTQLWVLPNPSGLNAHYQAADFAKLFKALRRAGQRTAQ